MLLSIVKEAEMMIFLCLDSLCTAAPTNKKQLFIRVDRFITDRRRFKYFQKKLNVIYRRM